MLSVAKAAQEHRVKRLVFAHIGRPMIKAMTAGKGLRSENSVRIRHYLFFAATRPRAKRLRRRASVDSRRPKASKQSRAS